MHRHHHLRPCPDIPRRPAGPRPHPLRRGLRAWVTGLVALALATAIAAPVAALQTANPAWATFTEELVGSNILSLLLEEGGAVWFGTGAGISRFDGRWQSFTTAEGLPASPVTALARTPDGTVWAGTPAGLAHTTTPAHEPVLRFTPYPEVPGAVRALAVDPSGTLWVGLDDGVGSITADGWRPLPPAAGQQPLGRVLAIAVDSNDDLWFGGDTLHHYDPATATLRAVEFRSTSPIRALLVQPPTESWSQTLWVGTQSDGLWSYNQQEWAHFLRPADNGGVEGIGSNAVLALDLDPEGTLWVGTDGSGISLFNRAGLSILWGNGFWRSLTTLDGLAANAVGALAVDDHGVAWMGTIFGANRFDSQTWRTISSPDLPAGLDVVTELVDPNGALWAGTEGSGLIRYNGRTLDRFTAAESGLPEDYVRTLAMDRAGNLWLGTATQGVAVVPLASRNDPGLARAAPWSYVGPEILGSGVMRAAITARDGSLWLGTYDAGLAHFIPEAAGLAASASPTAGRWERFTAADGLASDEINQDALLEDSSGAIWAGTPAGLARFDPASGTWRTYTTAAGLDDDAVLSLAEVAAADPGAGLYAGTLGGGLHHWDPDQDLWVRVLSLPTPINSIVAVPGQGIWLGGSGGVTRFDPATGLRATYTRADGLVDNHVSALAAGPGGELWVGTRLGISRHQPSPRRPAVEITSIDGRKPGAGEVSVLSGEPVVVAYRGSDLVAPVDDLGYRLRLRETGEAWRETRERQMTYRDLAPGAYTVEVQAWNDALNLAEPPATAILRVVPAVVLPWIGRVTLASAITIGAFTLAGVVGTSGFLLLSLRNRRRRHEALQRRFNPYVSGDPIQDSNLFFGREQTLGKIVNTLHENSIMIHGERRIGKTSLLYQLEQQLRTADDPDYLFVPVYVDLEGTAEDELFHVLMEEILETVPSYLPELPELRFDSLARATYDDRDFAHDLGALLEGLDATTSKDVRLILLLDEMDVINDYDPVVQQKLRRIFMRTFARSLGAVVAGTQISKEWDRVESPWYNLFNEIELGPLDRESALRLIHEPVQGIYTYDPAAVDFIVDNSHGRPFYVQQHCLEAINIMLAAGRTRVTLEDTQQALAAVAGVRTAQTTNGTPSWPPPPSTS